MDMMKTVRAACIASALGAVLACAGCSQPASQQQEAPSEAQSSASVGMEQSAASLQEASSSAASASAALQQEQDAGEMVHLVEGADDKETVRGYSLVGGADADAAADGGELVFKPSGELESGQFTKLSVKVDGTTAFKVSDTEFYSYDADFIRLSNGKTYLRLNARGDNDASAFCNIYEYSPETGALQSVLSCTNIIASKYGWAQSATVADVAGEDIVLDVRLMSWTAGSMTCTLTYTYDFERGVLVPKSTTGPAKCTAYDEASGKTSKYFTVNRPVMAYANAGTTQELGELAEGLELSFVKARVKGSKFSLKYKTRNGDTGWIKALAGSTAQTGEPVFGGTLYAG